MQGGVTGLGRHAQHAEFAKLSSDQSGEEAGHFRNFSASD